VIAWPLTYGAPETAAARIGERMPVRGERSTGDGERCGRDDALARPRFAPHVGRMSTSASIESAVLAAERDRAERRLIAVRAIVLVLLALAAGAYAPELSFRLNVVNAIVLAPMLAWTAIQFLVFYRAAALPQWVAIVNPIADVTAVSVAIAGYGLEAAPSLALKSPMVLGYLVILAARPTASSVRKTAVVSILAVVEYALIDAFFITTHNVALLDPVAASLGAGISLLDEGAKLVLLATGGGIATYATWWHERLARRYSAEALERERLQTRLAASRLDSLKQQLQPHFLFNALNAITALIETDTAAAQRMIAGLGELIRVSLDAGGAQEVTLARELAILAHYAAIQRVRFEDRLTIVMSAADGVSDALVPALVLQPLVENSIKHGLGESSAPARVDVRAWRDGDALVLSVADDGPGLRGQSSDALVERVGVGNARARLRYLYGARHSFTIDSPADGGFAVRMRIPYHTTPLASAGPLAQRASLDTPPAAVGETT
jgi:signal transduction histidine kinase